MHLFLSAVDDERFLADELSRTVPGAAPVSLSPGLLRAEFAPGDHEKLLLAFVRQFLPDAIALRAPSINAWAAQLFDSIVARVPGEPPWHLHIDAHYGAAGAGQNRCELIRERVIELLGKKRRQLRRTLVKEPQPSYQARMVGGVSIHGCGQTLTETQVGLPAWPGQAR